MVQYCWNPVAYRPYIQFTTIFRCHFTLEIRANKIRKRFGKLFLIVDCYQVLDHNHPGAEDHITEGWEQRISRSETERRHVIIESHDRASGKPGPGLRCWLSEDDMPPFLIKLSAPFEPWKILLDINIFIIRCIPLQGLGMISGGFFLPKIILLIDY